MHCLRCAGLLVQEYCYDLLDDSGQLRFMAWRCVSCGDVIDPLILNNRQKRCPSFAPIGVSLEAPVEDLEAHLAIV
ncbi:MAG: hypothetical protein L0Z46_08765 [Nitrospiraceae bacterium]|nr:hypothetical protein [Nitrospiraceae bacterium]